jgi:hypothetical protein
LSKRVTDLKQTNTVRPWSQLLIEVLPQLDWIKHQTASAVILEKVGPTLLSIQIKHQVMVGRGAV